MTMTRTLAIAVLYTAACGGSAPPPSSPSPAPVAETPGPVTRPDPAADPAPVRAAMMVSSSMTPPTAIDENDPQSAPRTGPRFEDEPLPAVTPQPAAKGCSPDKFVAEGKDKLAAGMHASALAAFEKALVCVHDPEIERYAVLAACQGKLYARARAHFIRLAEPDKPKLAQICHGPYF